MPGRLYLVESARIIGGFPSREIFMPPQESMRTFLLKSFAFSIVFLLCLLLVYRPLNALLWDWSSSASAKAREDAYDAQLKLSEAVLTKSEQYADRMGRLIDLQEDTAKRQAAVTGMWERQGGPR